MKDNYSSKRRYYLNKKDKNNSYNKTNEKNDFGFSKTEFNRNKEKEKNIEENINKYSRFKKNNNDDSNKKNNIKNFILFSNVNESKNSKKDEIKNINYFRFSGSDKKLFSQKEYINSSSKINNNLQTNQGNNKLNGNSYNKSFEINNIKSKVKNDYKETYNKNKNPILNTGNYKKDNKISNLISSVKLTNNSNLEKEKEKKEPVNQEKKLRNFFSLYGFRNKKKEIIKIESVWRGYYFRLKNIRKIKLNIFAIKLVKLLFKINTNKLKLFFNEFIKILKNYTKKKDKFGKINSVEFTAKYNGYTRKKKNHNFNHTSNITKVNNDNNSPRNKTNTNNIKTYSKLSGINSESNKKKSYKYKNEEKNINDIDDIFNGPLKIIYIPKKVYNKNRYYYMKRITNIKKLKLEKFIKFIKKKYLSIYFNIFKNNNKSNSDFFKIKKLVLAIDSIFKDYLKNYLKIYREKILDIKVKEEVIKKKTLSIINETDNNIKLFRQRRILNENKAEKKSPIKLKRNIDKNIKVKFFENNLIDDIIMENINESENEDENQKINTKYKKEKDKFILLNKIVSKKIKYNLIILNKYFNRWKQFSNLFNDNGPRIKFRNMHSPDMQIRGKKKHIKIKLSSALTSKTSLSSIKSEGRSNSSSHFYIKKMKVRSVVINTNNYSIVNFKTENNYKKNTKLNDIINKIDNKCDIIKCFKIWKKGKRNRRSLSQY